MLSKKMAVSLTSLILILALALVTVPVMAADDFDATFTWDSVIRESAIVVTLTFGEVVGLTNVQAATVNVRITDANGVVTELKLTGTSAVSNIGPVVLKDLQPAVAGDQVDGKTFTFTIPAASTSDGDTNTTDNNSAVATKSIDFYIAKGVATFALDDAKTSKVGKATITLQAPSTTISADVPKVVSIQRLRPGSQTVVAAFQEEKIPAEPFNVRIVLTDAPHGIDLAAVDNLVEVENGIASNLVVGTKFEWFGGIDNNANRAQSETNRPFAIRPHPLEGMYEHNGSGVLAGVPGAEASPVDTVPLPTGNDNMYHQFRVTITPHQKTSDFQVKVRVKSFHDNESPVRRTYVTPDWSSMPNGRDVLSIDVAKVDPAKLKAGYRVPLPKEIVIPAGGYLVVTKNSGDSKIKVPADSPKAPDATKRTPEEMKYNVQEASSLPNLATALVNGAVIDVEYGAKLVIHEVMWGEDAGIGAPENNQWIELHNPGTSAIETVDDDPLTLDIDERLTLVFYTQHELKNGGVPAGTLPITITGTMGTKNGSTTIQDRIGTLNAAGNYWSPIGVGQSGRTSVDPGEDVLAISPTQDVISMSRMLDGAGAVTDGQVKAGWTQSGRPSTNFIPGASVIRIATPGAAPLTTPEDIQAQKDAEAAQKKAEEDKKKAEARAGSDDVMITEIMVDTDSGRLPQWIELTYTGTGEVSLDDWEMVIDNAIDAEVLGGGNAITVSLSGVKLDVSKHPGNTGKGQSVLVVAWVARDVSNNIRTERVINLATQLDKKSRYQLLSYNGFRITLVPPRTGATTSSFGDIAGNLHEDWDIPMDGRSSLIRAGEMGTDADGWTLASKTNLVIGQPSFYGDDEDAGTPGHAMGGPLPVELSHFRPARDKATGAVVITWATQSELNNAGFFIKRSQQRNGEFKVINATMIAGAGTTSEKQFYTYTDTTAQPNVVYYYQIEDVSLDGNRQTLTRGIRLKGHIGAAGKLTSTWGELKTSNE